MWKIVPLVLAAVFAVGFGVLVGGFSEIDVNDPGVQDIANFAVDQHDKSFNDEYTRVVARVVKAARQVVSGFKYIITVEISTRCKTEGCGGLESAQTYNCIFTLWDRPWLRKTIMLLSKTCEGQN